MQSLPENATFFCADCKAQFNSAALLLNHFSQHIYLLEKHGDQIKNSYMHKQDNSTLKKDNRFTLSEQEQKTESILEHVLRQSLLDVNSCDSNIIESSVSNSDYCASTTDNDVCSSEQEEQIPLSVIEIGQRTSLPKNTPSDMMLATFDLQQRLENCIFKLVSKKDSTLENTTLSKFSKPIQTPSISSSKNNPDHEDFNPLTFCVVTMDEGEDNIELDAAQCDVEDKIQCSKSSKMASNRKQRTPRKIHNAEEKAKTSLEHLVIEENKEALVKASKKKYPCNVCWKVFGWSTDLKRHVLTHTGERPFKCHQCPATFTRNFLLQKHETKAHQHQIIHGAENPSFNLPATKITLLPIQTSDEIDPPKTTIVESQLKRKKKNPQMWNKKKMVCKSIPLGIFTPKALNIS